MVFKRQLFFPVHLTKCLPGLFCLRLNSNATDLLLSFTSPTLSLFRSFLQQHHISAWRFCSKKKEELQQSWKVQTSLYKTGKKGEDWVMRCSLTKCFLSETESRWFANAPPLHFVSLLSSLFLHLPPYFSFLLYVFALLIPFCPWIASRIPRLHGEFQCDMTSTI